MLTAVEQHQHAAVSQGCDEIGKGILGAHFQTEHGGYRAQYQAGVAEWRQIDQPDALLISADHPLRDGEGDRGLADAAGPDNRDEALPREL
jgi:hypothetical protein